MSSFFEALGRAAATNDDYVICLPCKRAVPVMLIAFVLLAAFTAPLFTVGGCFAGEGDDSLFSLMFKLFWMVGWSTGVLLLLLFFLSLVMGRETRNSLTSENGIPGIALAASFSPDMIRNFRYLENGITDYRNFLATRRYVGQPRTFRCRRRIGGSSSCT